MITGTTLVAGTADSLSVRLHSPLSFWGGIDHQGSVSDSHHPQRGTLLAGTILLMRSGRGSSSSSSVLAELIRAGTSPAAIVLSVPDAIITLGAIVAAELYQIKIPVVLLSEAAHDAVPDATTIHLRANDWGATLNWSPRTRQLP